MNQKIYIIGRKPNTAQGEIPIPIIDPSNKVSSNHCRILFDGANYFIEDLISTNGTFVNGNRISSITPVNMQSNIMLGTNYRFELSSLIQANSNQSFQLENQQFSEEGINMSVGYVFDNGFNIGFKNTLSLMGCYLLWILTFWVPYVNIGTTIAISNLPLALSKGKIISPLEIFDSNYRKNFGEFFLLIALILLGLIIVLPFTVIPFIVLALSWSQATLIFLDKNYNITESLNLSNKITYGYKWNMFFIYLLAFLCFPICILLIVAIAFLINEISEISAIIFFILLSIPTFFIWLSFLVGIKAVFYQQLSKRLK